MLILMSFIFMADISDLENAKNSKIMLDDIKEKYPEKNYNLTDMAKKANMCVSGFTKKFRNLLGVSPMEYLLSLRIEKAEQMLL